MRCFIAGCFKVWLQFKGVCTPARPEQGGRGGPRSGLKESM